MARGRAHATIVHYANFIGIFGLEPCHVINALAQIGVEHEPYIYELGIIAVLRLESTLQMHVSRLAKLTYGHGLIASWPCTAYCIIHVDILWAMPRLQP